MYLNEWRSVARSICEITGSDSSLPHLLRTAVEKLQQQEISLTSAKVELESQLNTALYVSIHIQEQKILKLIGFSYLGIKSNKSRVRKVSEAVRRDGKNK